MFAATSFLALAMAMKLYSATAFGCLGQVRHRRGIRRPRRPRLSCPVQGTIKRVTNMKVVIETPRLILREFQPPDADALARVISDPETMRFYRTFRSCGGGRLDYPQHSPLREEWPRLVGTGLKGDRRDDRRLRDYAAGGRRRVSPGDRVSPATRHVGSRIGNRSRACLPRLWFRAPESRIPYLVMPAGKFSIGQGRRTKRHEGLEAGYAGGPSPCCLSAMAEEMLGARAFVIVVI